MVELCHGAVAVEYGKQHVGHGIWTKAVALREIVNDPLAFGSELLHADTALERLLRSGAARHRAPCPRDGE
jgi:hypothetical protein